ncbi:MAG: acetate/propionate family kinase [Candidatus Aegiribacteria sp.]|nr:acetate/propionate family kinase [Candidatus Aegiribacteria sp.]
MKILVINSGSSSIKFKLIDMENETLLAEGLIERISLPEGRIKFKSGEKTIIIEEPVPDHRKGINFILNALTNPEYGPIESYSEIGAVGHRVVHGGEKFTSSVIIDEEVIQGIEDCSFMAPLHNPPNLQGISATMETLPGIPNVAVFDTAFHQTMPPVSYIYPVPYSVFEEKRIRRFGFHGPSHQYVSGQAAIMMDKPIEELCIITCHLGNGSSLTAVKHGKSMDTSLGYGTACGVMMGTRSGDVDSAVLIDLVENYGYSIFDVKEMVYKKSGIVGISEISSDQRDIEDAAEEGNERAQLALDMFASSVRKYIGAYAVTMGALDAIVFTAGVGENGPQMRERICRGLEVLGVSIDIEANDFKGLQRNVSAPDSRVEVLVIPTNEELMIARETNRLSEGK